MNVKACARLLAFALLFADAPNAPAAPAPQLAAAPTSYAGTYRYKTYRPGKEGYDNTLEVEDRGGGRLHVTLSGTYIYKANGEETMHEGGGEGDATLRGNVATASVTPDGGDAPCRVLIIFEGSEAGVKADSSCGFNVNLDGTYRNEKAGAARQGASPDAAGLRQVRYDRLSGFVNDHQANRTGLRFVVTSVPAEKIKLVKNLRASASAEVATLRVTAVLVEFLGEFDVYRSSFVTRVEGFGEDGALLWIATGAEPVKVKMRQ